MTPDDSLASPLGPPPSWTVADRLLLRGAVLAFGGLLLLVTLWSLSRGLVLVWAVPALIVAGLVVVLARPSTPTQLGIVLAAQVLQLGGQDGVGLGEALAALLMVGFIVRWYLTTWLERRRVVLSSFDAVALGWGTLGLVAAAVLGQVFGSYPDDFRADLIATLPFMLYLPIKDICMRYRNGAFVVGAMLVWFGLFATVSNGLLLRSVISGATEAWEIADARFGVGETSISAALFLCFGWLAVTRKRGFVLGLMGLLGALLGGLILTKSRGFWVSCIVGLVVLMAVVRAPDRRRLGVAVVLGVASLVAVAILFFGEQMTLLAAGVLKRFVTLGSAASKDYSLLNRFVESQAVWEEIRLNPIVGYGWGNRVARFSILDHYTIIWGFFHNGYLALWHKTGLWGLGMMMWVWIGAMVRSALAGRDLRLPVRERAMALGTGGVLVAFSIVVSTSNPFSVPDQMLVVTTVLALAHGLRDRARLCPNPTDPAS